MKTSKAYKSRARETKSASSVPSLHLNNGSSSDASLEDTLLSGISENLQQRVDRSPPVEQFRVLEEQMNQSTVRTNGVAQLVEHEDLEGVLSSTPLQLAVDPMSSAVSTLIGFIDSVAAGKWAFTGGVAQYLQAMSRNLTPSRLPNDIDIVVETHSFNAILQSIHTGYNLPGIYRPAGGGISRTVMLPGFKLDVIRDGSGFGNLSEKEKYGSFPILPVKELIERKEDISEEEFETKDKKDQAMSDLIDLKDQDEPNKGRKADSIPTETSDSAKRMHVFGVKL